MRISLVPALLIFTMAACAPQPEPEAQPAELSPVEVFLPTGDPGAGRQAFLDMRCHTCHVVVGEEMDAPVAPVHGPELGPILTGRSRDDLATSIITPSHFDSERAGEFMEGALSRMGDYTYVMTIRQLIDIVAFLQSISFP